MPLAWLRLLTLLHPLGLVKVKCCGLCGLEFEEHNLPGVVSYQAIANLRAKWGSALPADSAKLRSGKSARRWAGRERSAARRKPGASRVRAYPCKAFRRFPNHARTGHVPLSLSVSLARLSREQRRHGTGR